MIGIILEDDDGEPTLSNMDMTYGIKDEYVIDWVSKQDIIFKNINKLDMLNNE